MAGTNTLELAASLNSSAQGAFDGDAAVLPIPDDAPPETPRVLLRSKSGHRECQLSFQRLDLTFRRAADSPQIDLPNPELRSLLLRLRGTLVSHVGHSFPRAGLISRWGIEYDLPARQFLVSHYLRDGSPCTSANELEIHALHNLQVAGCKANEWIRLRAAGEAPRANHLFALIDVNTSIEETYDFSGALADSLFQEADRLTNDLLRQYVTE